MLHPVAFGACIALLCLGQAAPGPREWKDFGVGASASIRTRQWSPAGRLSDDWTLTTTYRGVEGENAVFDLLHVAAGEPAADAKSMRRLRPFSPEPFDGKVWMREKEETIRLAGRDVLCVVHLRKSPAGESRIWVAKEASGIPDPVVKEEIRGESDVDTGQVGDWDASVTIGEQTHRCVRYDFKKTHVNPATSFSFKAWKSTTVPGHLVKSECDYGGGGRQLDELVASSVPAKK